MSFLKKSSFLLITLAVIAAGAVLFLKEVAYAPTFSPEGETPVAKNNTEDVAPVASVEKEVSTPEPLQGSLEPSEGVLTASGTIAETNRHRAQFSLPPLSFNAKLAAAAETKARDMITRQYFEHESPEGIGPGELADWAGYTYLSVGENLALGNYENDAVLVQAWMDSPGHRENILSTQYREIGVAVVEGTFEGDQVWFAVQEFGRPASDCPSPSSELEENIEDTKQALEYTKELLDEALQEIEETTPKRGTAYNEKVGAYNALVESYNKLLAETKKLIETYNAQVSAYNECI